VVEGEQAAEREELVALPALVVKPAGARRVQQVVCNLGHNRAHRQAFALVCRLAEFKLAAALALKLALRPESKREPRRNQITV
jgi:hypothetical protein